MTVSVAKVDQGSKRRARVISYTLLVPLLAAAMGACQLGEKPPEPTKAPEPVALWSLDGPEATTDAEPMRPGVAVTVGGGKPPSTYDAPLWGTATLGTGVTGASLAGDGYMGAPLKWSAGTEWAVDHLRAGDAGRCWLYLVTRDASNSRVAWIWSTDADRKELTVSTATHDKTQTLATLPAPAVFDGAAHHIRLHVKPDGTGSAWTLLVDGRPTGNGRADITAHHPHFVGIGWGGGLVRLARVAVWPSPPPAQPVI